MPVTEKTYPVILQFIRTQNHLFPVKISKSQYQII